MTGRDDLDPPFRMAPPPEKPSVERMMEHSSINLPSNSIVCLLFIALSCGRCLDKSVVKMMFFMMRKDDVGRTFSNLLKKRYGRVNPN